MLNTTVTYDKKALWGRDGRLGPGEENVFEWREDGSKRGGGGAQKVGGTKEKRGGRRVEQWKGPGWG